MRSYRESMVDDVIDWGRVIGPRCPVCGQVACYRRIGWYWRKAIELFPYREELIPVARFRCRTRMRTFSMLPHQLAPYHQYTIVSMLLMRALVTARPSQSLEATTLELDADSRVLPHLVRVWSAAVEVGLQRLRVLPDVPELLLDELALQCPARGPPTVDARLAELVRHYSELTNQWLMGCPSQQRGRGVSAAAPG